MSDENIHTDITLNDVNIMLQIIDVCAKRGAFHPDEFVPVGTLTNKLKAVVEKAKLDAEKEGREEEQVIEKAMKKLEEDDD